ncbi:MAG: hypothetical protein LBP79_01805 [Clostridiales bacterium]|jgi:hypothetical protein|nr:hypothetical protein [Clostridiales bacterium]
MKKNFLKIIRLFVFIFAGVLSVPLALGQPSGSFTKAEFTKRDYSNIMKENISGNPLVTDIAMLAAHDALSSEINRKSPVNFNEKENFLASPSLNFLTKTGAMQILFGGLATRISRAQRSSVGELLQRGARYLDIRVAECGGWYGCHGLIAAPLGIYFDDILEFLERTDGEIIVLEFRHVYFGESDYAELFSYIENYKPNGKSVYDYVRYNPREIPLGELRYGTVTNGGSGAVILTPEAHFAKNAAPHIAYADAPYAVWHNLTDKKQMFAGIREEYAYLTENYEKFRGVFRINQAQRTPRFDADSVFGSIIGWSLIDMAEKYNYELLCAADFSDWLSVMPVFQVDYADDMYGGFNDKVIEKINGYNAKLAECVDDM